MKDFLYILYIYVNTQTVNVATCGLVLNLTCILSLFCVKGSLSTQLKLLLSLAVCDCLIDFISIGTAINIIFYDDTLRSFQIYSAALILLQLFVQWPCLLTMLSLAVDLFIRVKKPLNYSQLMSKRRGTILILCIWTLPVLFLIVVYTITGQTDFMTYIESILSVAILLSLIVFCVLYSCIVCQVRTISTNRPRTLRRTLVTSILIIVSYAICFTPASILRVCRTFGNRCKWGINPFLVLFTVNTIIVPIVYATRVPEVNSRLKTVVKCFQRLRSGEVAGSMDVDNINVAVIGSGQLQQPEHIALT